MPIPGASGALSGRCYVHAATLAKAGLKDWLEVNPRTPARAPGLNDRLVQSVCGWLLHRGLTLHVAAARHSGGTLTLELKDPKLHGVLDRGVDLLILREALKHAEKYPTEIQARLSSLHVLLIVNVRLTEDEAVIGQIVDGLSVSAPRLKVVL
jgi:hypothetical protein